MAFKGSIVHWVSWLRSGIRFGETKRSWRSYRIAGEETSDQAILMIGGLSSNAATTNRTLAQTLHRDRVMTWSRNLFGHTGLFSDFSRSRFWNWIADGIIAMRKLIHRHKRSDLVLVGHSTGSLVVLAILILRQLLPRWLLKTDQATQIRGVLIFPPFRLQRRLDTRLLWTVAVLYYIICPAAFALLAISGPWMWPISLVAYLLHLYLVPKIYVPSGDQRAEQPDSKRRRAILSESVLLAVLCIYFVAAPPLIAIAAQLISGIAPLIVFGGFIVTLVVPLLMIPQSPVEMAVTADCRDEVCQKRHVGYRWLPVITVANLVIFQFVIKFFLRFCSDPILLIEGGQDKVVVVDESYVSRLGENVKRVYLADFPHSDLSWQQQTDLAGIIVDWLENSSKPVEVETASS